MGKKVLWLKVSDDKYELPMAVADSVSELARMVGVKKESISSYVSRGGEKCNYKKVVIDDE